MTFPVEISQIFPSTITTVAFGIGAPPVASITVAPDNTIGACRALTGTVSANMKKPVTNAGKRSERIVTTPASLYGVREASRFHEPPRGSKPVAGTGDLSFSGAVGKGRRTQGACRWAPDPRNEITVPSWPPRAAGLYGAC